MVNIRSLVLNTRLLLLFFLALMFIFGMTTVLISPSHPFIDSNNNGIDDGDEQNEEFKVRAQKYGLKFPIENLNGCKNYYECKSFCEDPVNGAACISYAKDKGFHKEDDFSKKKDEIVARAKKEFGCDSYGSCKAFCEIPTNYDTCNGFARKNNISGGHVDDPQEKRFVEKAKEILGCDSAQACSNFCGSDQNRDKCSDFARKLGLRGGEERHGPGGCTSEDTCKAFCSDPINFQQCSQFSAGPGGAVGGPGRGGFKGPGGCASEEACRNYCETNPQDCRIIAPTSLGVIDDPMKAAEEYKKFCQSGPGKCEGGGQAIFSSSEGRAEFERFCSANPERCGAKEHFSQTAGDRRAESERYCKDNPGKCQSGPGGYPIPEGRGGPSDGSYVDPGDYCKRYPDRCPNEGDYKHRFEESGSYDPATMCSKAPGCRWEGGSCKCGVYGGQQGTTGGGPTTPGDPNYSYPTPYSGTGDYRYSYPTPYSGTSGTTGDYKYSYPTPYTGSGGFPTSYPTPYTHTGTTSYPTPYSYQTPSGGYGTPSYGTPDAYQTPSYGTPSYGTPDAYQTPAGGTHGISKSCGLLQTLLGLCR